MACSNSVIAESRGKRKRLSSHSLERPQEEERDECLDQKKTRPSTTWANLDLILSLQSKDLPLERKINLALDFTSLETSASDGLLQPVSISRALSYTCSWIQPLLMSSDHEKKNNELLDPCLDYRCWAILKFCIEKSSCGISPNLLRAVARVLKQALFPLDCNDTSDGVEFNRLFQNVLECLTLLIASNSRAFYNVGMDLWISCATNVVNLINRVSSRQEDAPVMAKVYLAISAILLEHFASFLRFHPNPKNVFPVFVDRLLESLLELLVLLRLRTKRNDCEHLGSLVVLVQDVLSNGLFHPTHVGGFLSSRSSMRKQEGSRSANESYHRHLFRKLERIIAEKKLTALGGFGCLVHLFACKIKGTKGDSMSFRGCQTLRKDCDLSGDAQDASRPLFEVFVQFMEPLLHECKYYAEEKLSSVVVGSENKLMEVHCMLRSVNETLESFMQENVYIRTEDTPDKSYYNFLKEVFDIIFSISVKMHWFLLSASNAGVQKMVLIIAREIVVAVTHLLEMEYKVFGDDLVMIWLMLLSYLAANMSLVDAKPCSLLIQDILSFGCKLIKVYREIRQVNIPIFAFCKAMRLLINPTDASLDAYEAFSSSSLSSQFLLEAAQAFVCSQEFRFTIADAVKSVPEGQAGGCVQQVAVDIADSLGWIRGNTLGAEREKLNEDDNTDFNVHDIESRAEFLGRVLSEIHTTVLDSLTVTTTNSVFIGNSMKSLIKTLRPTLACFVQTQSNNVNGFFFSIIDRKLSNCGIDAMGKNSHIKVQSVCWLFLFFFRVYISCRSLYRQLVSLLPPDSSRKTSESLGDLYTTSSFMNWVETPEHMDEGYFSLIAKPSMSLPEAIKILSENCLSSSFAAYAPFIYVMQVMALQRLSDLSRLVRAFKFFHEKDTRLNQMQLQDVANLQRSNKNWKQIITVFRQEAVELTNLIIVHLSLFDSKGLQLHDVSENSLVCEGEWDFGVCTLNEKSLRVAVWWLYCQTFDVWCAYSTKKHLKRFLSCLFLYSLPCSGFCREVMDETFCHAITLHHISLSFLQDISCKQMILLKKAGSRFCHILKKTLLPIFSHTPATDIDFSSLPEWEEFLNLLDKGEVTLDVDVGLPMHDGSFRLDKVLPSKMYIENTKRLSVSSFSLKLKTVENLLNLFCKIPLFYGDETSFKLCATHMLNIERLVLLKLIDHHDESVIYDPYELLRLLVSCRRAIKYLVMVSAERLGVGESPSFYSMFDCPSSVLWLFKSVYKVVGLRSSFFWEKYSRRMEDMICSLMDCTSYIFLKISEAKSNVSLLLLVKNKFNKENIALHNLSKSDDELPEYDSSLQSSECYNGWGHLKLVLEALREHAEKLVFTLKISGHNVKQDGKDNSMNWNIFSSVISCFQGILLGMSSAFKNIFEEKALELPKASSLIPLCVSELRRHFAVFQDLINLCLNMLIGNHSQVTKSSLYANDDSAMFDSVDGTQIFDITVDSTEPATCQIENSMENHACVMDSYSLDSPSGSSIERKMLGMSSLRKRRSPASHLNWVIDFFRMVNKVDLRKLKIWDGLLSHSLLQDGNPQVAYVLRQLFLTSATIIKLKCLPFRHPKYVFSDCQSTMSFSVTLFKVSYVILQEFSDMTVRPYWILFALVDAALTILDVIGSLFRFVDPHTSEDVYTLLIELHLKAIGKCICLQGKAATLSSHDIESDTEMLQTQNGTDNNFLSHKEYSINAFKSKLIISFKKYIQLPSTVYLRLAIQAIERRLVGVRQDYVALYELSSGNIGGRVSPSAAASIVCLELIIEFSGHNQFLKKRMPSLVNAIINIIVHIQSSSIFYIEKLNQVERKVDTDTGAVMLMCVVILTKIAGRHSFQMESYHVSQCFHMPLLLFEGFHKLRASSVTCNSSVFSDNNESRLSIGTQQYVVHHQFCVELYTSCCRLLCSTLMNQKCKAERCIALLEESVSLLLGSLEFVDCDLAKREGYFSWKLQEAITCASFLRRIYEEIRRQKDALGKYASFFLSNYVSTFSGCSRTKAGIRREIDETLRPGVYSLIDVCSRTDLQQLHTVLGEGPCRSTLASLIHEYQRDFQFKGKI